MNSSENEYYTIKTNDNLSLAVRARKSGQGNISKENVGKENIGKGNIGKGNIGKGNIGIFFCCGYTSDLTGTKASRLFTIAQQKNVAAVLFDYRGHGKSDGKIEDATIGQWIEDSLTVLDHACSKIVSRWLVIGSSMGGWIALHILKARRKNVAALLLIAPALDFPEKLLLPSFPKKEQKKIQEGGQGKWCEEGKTPEQGYILTKKFLSEARKHHLLDKTEKIPAEKILCPVPLRMIAGLNDDIVPFAHMIECFKIIEPEDDSADALAIVVQKGDHMLSREQDLDLIEKTTLELLEAAKNKAAE